MATVCVVAIFDLVFHRILEINTGWISILAPFSSFGPLLLNKIFLKIDPSLRKLFSQ